MKLWSAIVYVMVCMTVVYGYSCPDIEGIFFHADVESGCQVYHRCEGTEMTIMVCPTGEAFDYESNQCKDRVLVRCMEINSDHLHRRKRSTDLTVHSINREHLREGMKKLFRSVIPLIGETVKDVAPSVYSQIETDYAPMVGKFQSEMMPFIKDRVLPRAQKAFTYAKNMGERIFEKIHQSYELSNSTYITIVSFADIVSDISRDIEPLMKLGKFLAARLGPHSRAKRSVETQEEEEKALDMLVEFMEPFFIELVRSAQDFVGNHVNVSSLVTDLAKNGVNLTKLKKYLAALPRRHTRTKRAADEEEEEEVPDMLVGIVEPVFARVISTIQKIAGGDGNSITSKIILPVFYEMAADRETTFYIKQLFWNLKSAISPIISDMLSQQDWNSGAEITVKIPREEVSAALSRFQNRVQPLFKKIMRRHSRGIFLRMADNVPLLFDTWDRFQQTSPARFDILKDSITRFFNKHYDMIRTSSPTHFYSYALTEILRDLRPIEVTLGQMFLEYMKLTPNSLYHTFFSRNSLIYRLVMGEGAPHYAVPRS